MISLSLVSNDILPTYIAVSNPPDFVADDDAVVSVVACSTSLKSELLTIRDGAKATTLLDDEYDDDEIENVDRRQLGVNPVTAPMIVANSNTSALSRFMMEYIAMNTTDAFEC
jgi:hypothetical protein